MARQLRIDYPGAWHNIGNRGIAQRTIFESRRELRYFLALMAWKVHAGELEVHAYCLLLNHFHMLVKSPIGLLSHAMQGIQDKYAARFNRNRDRDGHLFKGRFWSKLIHGIAYRVNALRYIEENPVRAGLVARASDYAFGSAFHYSQTRRPPWLATEFGDRLLQERRQFGGVSSDATEEDGNRTRELMERMVASTSPCIRELDSLLAGSSKSTRVWMVHRANLADGVPPGLVLAHPETTLELIQQRRTMLPDLRVRLTRKSESAWSLLEPGLLRTVCGLSMREIAARLAQDPATISRRIRRHRRAMQTDPSYSSVAAEIVHRALRRAWRM